MSVLSPGGQSDMATSSPNLHSEGEFVRLYTASSRRIYTYILTLLPNRTDAEDVFQDVSVLLWEKFPEFTPGTQFSAWACRIAYFKALSFGRAAACASGSSPKQLWS